MILSETFVANRSHDRKQSCSINRQCSLVNVANIERRTMCVYRHKLLIEEKDTD
jgi:hypothetical protein